jgi:hypothetical protein
MKKLLVAVLLLISSVAFSQVKNFKSDSATHFPVIGQDSSIAKKVNFDITIRSLTDTSMSVILLDNEKKFITKYVLTKSGAIPDIKLDNGNFIKGFFTLDDNANIVIVSFGFRPDHSLIGVGVSNEKEMTIYYATVPVVKKL